MSELKRFALALVGHFLASLLYVLQRLHIVNAVVDTTSILEHREELRELWEKRMMADENQSPPSSAVEEKTQTLVEEVKEVEVTKANREDETTKHNHLTNGFAKSIPENNIHGSDTNANHINETGGSVVQVAEAVAVPVVAPELNHEDNNNSADSLEVDNNNAEFVEEKTYTSELEMSLVVKQVTEVATTVVEDHVLETIHNEVVSDETVTTTTDEGDGQLANGSSPEKLTSPIVPDEGVVPSTHDTTATVETEVLKEISEQLVEIYQETVTSTTVKHDESHHEVDETSVVPETAVAPPMKSLDIPTPTDEEGDGFVPLAECLPKEDGSVEEQVLLQESSEKDTTIEEHKTPATNGYGDHSESSPTTSTPEPSLEDKTIHPEIEQFVKSGGLKRVLPGVQKTEQPYSSCTTETKIAMEIREMREREEELRVMREQALLSPVISPVPPKSPVGRSPSPSIKDCASPTPAGPGYRVSSVFGHKGTTSPSPPVVFEDDKKPFKGLAKESAVEKEIRMARDREEELRKQKGLPPREDDSYVKPSQVKSSQVRIFGKGGTNNASVKQAATAKIQMEIEEQTQREMALRDTGSIQTISQERTDAKVAKLNTPECVSPPLTNGNSQPHANGNYTNGRQSPDAVPYKRSSPSPTGIARPASIFSQTNGTKNNISMHKFITSKGKETTFTAPRNGNGPFVAPKEEKVAIVPPTMVKLKRTVSVESKIQQEIIEMKQREEELKMLHMNTIEDSNDMENGKDHEMNLKNNLVDYENGNGINEEDISPRHNKLIAQWEQRIQKAES